MKTFHVKIKGVDDEFAVVADSTTIHEGELVFYDQFHVDETKMLVGVFKDFEYFYVKSAQLGNLKK